jgi:hypothetical protein
MCAPAFVFLLALGLGIVGVLLVPVAVLVHLQTNRGEVRGERTILIASTVLALPVTAFFAYLILAAIN